MLSLTDAGLLACDPANRRVYAASTAVPRVHGYSGDGTLLWITELPGVEGAVIERTEAGVKWSLPEGKSTFGSVVTLSIVPQGHLLVQYEEQEWEQGAGDGPVVGSFLIDRCQWSDPCHIGVRRIATNHHLRRRLRLRYGCRTGTGGQGV